MESVFDDRPMLMNVAYRLLGVVSEAEDAVQEAFARWYAMPDADRRDISSPTGWLVTVTTRICLDVLGSARARRETYVGEWLPEPVSSRTRWTSHVLDERAVDPADRVSLDESLNMALLVVMETMTPAERVAFTLHDVFGHSFIEVAEIVGRSAQACRRLASSARRRVHQARRGYTPSKSMHRSSSCSRWRWRPATSEPSSKSLTRTRRRFPMAADLQHPPSPRYSERRASPATCSSCLSSVMI